MQEYWANVYKGNKLGGPLESRELCVKYNPSKQYIYRIHVKMKPYVFKNTELGKQAWQKP
jgi:hypothetical protein